MLQGFELQIKTENRSDPVTALLQMLKTDESKHYKYSFSVTVYVQSIINAKIKVI